MDPVSLVGLVQGSISLAVQCGSVAKSLNNLAGKYKNAELHVSTMVQNLDIMQFTWDRIGAWSKDYMPRDNDVITQRLERFLETGFSALDALEEDLESYSGSNLSFRQRSRLVWRESVLQGHQIRIRDQAQSMSLFLQAIQLPTPQATTHLLQKSEKQFMKSDESAFSIVPSRLSSRLSISSDQSAGQDSTGSFEGMVYRRLSFEDILFTARVYKRNYRSTHYRRLRKQELSKRLDAKASLIKACSRGDNDRVKSLLSMSQTSTAGGAEVSGFLDCRNCDSPHLCPIHTTVFSGRVEIMETLLQHAESEHKFEQVLEGAMYHTRGSRWSLLHVAAMKGSLSMVHLLLTKGASVNAETNCGIQAIHLAAEIGSTEILAALIAAGADVNSSDRDGRQPLHYISDSQDLPKVIEYLAEMGAYINGPHNSKEPTPIHLACKNNFNLNLKALLSLGALADDPLRLQSEQLEFGLEFRRERRESALLHTAIKHGSPLSVETLLEYGLDPNCCRAEGGTSLHTFVYEFYATAPRLRNELSDLKILQLLLDQVSLFAEDQNGHTVLDVMFNLQGKTDVIATLELARLFLDTLPVDRVFEKNALRSMMRSQALEDPRKDAS